MNKTEDLTPILAALKAEKRAIAYYARAAARITNPTGKEALKKLKAEEEKHYKNLRVKFKEIFGRDPTPGEEEKVPAHIFSLTEEHLPDKEASDLEVCHIAMKDEKESRAFYLNAAKEAATAETKELYEELAKEEVNHIATLKKVCQILSA